MWSEENNAVLSVEDSCIYKCGVWRNNVVSSVECGGIM